MALAALVLAATQSIAATPDSITLTAPLDSIHSATTESSMGDFVADSVLSAASDAQIAFVPAGELKSETIPAGTVKPGRLIECLRAGQDPADTVVTMRVPGSVVIDALNHGVSRAPSPFDGYLQVAGISVVYHSGADGRQLVQTVTLASGGQIRSGTVYVIAMPHFIADGALGYFSVWPSDNSAKDTGLTVATAVLTYAANHQPLDYQAGSRITQE